MSSMSMALTTFPATEMTQGPLLVRHVDHQSYPLFWSALGVTVSSLLLGCSCFIPPDECGQSLATADTHGYDAILQTAPRQILGST
jgi:hypothetical protein